MIYFFLNAEWTKNIYIQLLNMNFEFGTRLLLVLLIFLSNFTTNILLFETNGKYTDNKLYKFNKKQ